MTNIRKKHLLTSIIGIIAFEVWVCFSKLFLSPFDGSMEVYLLFNIPVQLLSIAIFTIGIAELKKRRIICVGASCIAEAIAIITYFLMSEKSLVFDFICDGWTKNYIREPLFSFGIGMVIGVVIAIVLGLMVKVRQVSIVRTIIIIMGIIAVVSGYVVFYRYAWILSGILQPIAILLPVLTQDTQEDVKASAPLSHLEEYKRRMRK